MNRTWIFIIVAGLLLVSCSSPKGIVILPEVPNEVAAPETPKTPETPKQVELLYPTKQLLLGASDSAEYASRLFTVLSVSRDSGVKVDVDGSKGYLIETKNFEVIGGLKITLLNLDYSDLNKARANLTLEEFKLGENEYLVSMDRPLQLDNVQVKLKEVGSDYVYVEVGQESSQKIFLNTEKGFGNVRIKLLKPFFKDTTRQPYAWLLVVQG